MPERDYSANAAHEEARREAWRGRRRLLHHVERGPCEALRQAQALARPSGRALDRLAKEGVEARHRPDFETVQRIGLDAGLVDNKSVAVDADWQAVRFVYRLSDR